MCCSSGSGATILPATAARSTFTSAGCARRLNPTPATRSISRRFVASATASRFRSPDKTREKRQEDGRARDKFFIIFSPICCLLSLVSCLSMSALDIILILALLAALGWALWLSRRLNDAEQGETPPNEEFSPLFRAATAALDAGLVVLDEERAVHYLNP